MNIDIDLTDIQTPRSSTLDAQDKVIIYCMICKTVFEDSYTYHNLDNCLENFQKRIRVLEERLGIK